MPIVQFFSRSSQKTQPPLGIPHLDAQSWRPLLSNFCNLPLTLEGNQYPSPEHAFHAAKYDRSTRPDLTHIFVMKDGYSAPIGQSPLAAKVAGSKKGMIARRAELDVEAWNSDRVGVQTSIHQARLEQHDDYRRILECAHTKGWTLLHFERSGAKSFWGGTICKQTGNILGKNTLGQLLQQGGAPPYGAVE